MDEYMESTTFVSINICGAYTYVQIKQLINDKINPNGIFLNSSDFGSLMYQLKAIENMFLLSASKQQTESAMVCDIDIQTSSNKVSIEPCDTDKQTNTSSTKLKQNKRKLKQELVKKETITKKIKKENYDSNGAVMKAYSQLLPNIIDRLIKSRCFGCMLNLDVSMGGHNICTDRKMYIEQCFLEAMSLVDEVKVAELVDCENIPLKTELLVDIEWCNSLKVILNGD